MNTQCPHCDCQDGYAIRHDHAINEEFLMVCDCSCHQSKPAGEASLCSSPSRQDNFGTDETDQRRNNADSIKEGAPNVPTLSLDQTESLCQYYDEQEDRYWEEDVAFYPKDERMNQI